MKTFDQLRGEISLGITAARDYKATEQTQHFVALLDALLATYSQELMTIAPEKLQFKQGAAMQIKALRDCMVGRGAAPSARV